MLRAAAASIACKCCSRLMVALPLHSHLTRYRCTTLPPCCSAPSMLDSLAAHLTTQLFFLGDAAEQLASAAGGSDTVQAVADAVQAVGDAPVQVRLRWQDGWLAPGLVTALLDLPCGLP